MHLVDDSKRYIYSLRTLFYFSNAFFLKIKAILSGGRKKEIVKNRNFSIFLKF